MTDALPAYANPVLKADLLAAGVSGTVYAMVMPETEAVLADLVGSAGSAARSRWLALYREPWAQRQDALHDAYFDRWLDWASPVVTLGSAAFPFRYPTAGASEGIYKLMAEHAARARAMGATPSVHLFDGDYEGFAAYASALSIPLVRHRRQEWRAVPARVPADAQFWVSQPSAIDGNVWAEFDAFAGSMADQSPRAAVIPDLTYVGSVARAYRFVLDHANVPAFVISHSKPFGGYYQRVGGVFARAESPSLFGSKWFKNLQSLAWATLMMERHDVFALPRRYRAQQEAACHAAAARLGLDGLVPADVGLLATAPVPSRPSPLIASLIRGTGKEARVRVCLTPAMSALIDPAMAPTLAPIPATPSDIAPRAA